MAIESSILVVMLVFLSARLPAPYTASAPARCNMYSQCAADFEELVGAPPKFEKNSELRTRAVARLDQMYDFQ